MKKQAFGKRSAMMIGSLALLSGALLPGCGAAATEDFGAISHEVVTKGDYLPAGEKLLLNEQLVSENGKYRATMQDDGNFVVYPNDGTYNAIWATGVHLPSNVVATNWRFKLDRDGNLLVRSPPINGVAGTEVRWQSGSLFRVEDGQPTNGFLLLDNHGGLTLYSGTRDNPGEKRWQSKADKYAALAKKFQPVINFRDDHKCFPLTFTEGNSGTSGHQNRCNHDFDSNFVVFSSVTDHPDDRPNSYRITYGVAFGWQSGTIELPGIPGSHGNDAQYLVVDVVDDRVISVWADMHQGHYARSAANGVVMNTSTNVTAWAGWGYNTLKLDTDRATVCKEHGIDPNISIDTGLAILCAEPCAFANTCGDLDTVLNWGDYVGQSIANQRGRMVMTDQACAAPTGQDYTSDGITFSATQLEGLRNFIGCVGASAPWDGGGSTYLRKDQAKDPYALTGCKSGNLGGGDICNGSHYSASQTWQTTKTYQNLYIEPRTAGYADVDYTAGGFFNDIAGIWGKPTKLEIRTGARVDRVAVFYGADNLGHGGSGGGLRRIEGIEADPIVSVRLCTGGKDGRGRAGYIKVRTRNGRTLEGGEGSDDCYTIEPAGKRFYGFYGRSGGEVDLLGTIWGDM